MAIAFLKGNFLCKEGSGMEALVSNECGENLLKNEFGICDLCWRTPDKKARNVNTTKQKEPANARWDGMAAWVRG